MGDATSVKSVMVYKRTGSEYLLIRHEMFGGMKLLKCQYKCEPEWVNAELHYLHYLWISCKQGVQH